MLLKIMNQIRRLQNSSFILQRDRRDIETLYLSVLQKCSDQNTFMERSRPIMEALGKGELTEEKEKEWLNYADNTYGAFLAIYIYEHKESLNWGGEEFQEVLNYFLEGKFHYEILSVGLYSCAQMLSASDPMSCYHLTMQAFRVNPRLGGLLNVEYIFEGEAAREHLTEECPFCSGTDLVPWYCSPQVLKLNGKNKFPPAKLWMKCKKCNNYFTYNFPLSDVDEINGHYTKKKETDALETRFPLAIYNHIFCHIKEMTEGNDYLEIGIGNGEMLAVALEFGYRADAVEICREDAERVANALGVHVECCDITDYETAKRYDVIIMGDVLEHVSRPVQILEKTKKLLKEDGVVWISTPNYNSAYARMEKFSHCMWHELNHYTYVSYESLKELLCKMDMKIVHYRLSDRYMGSMELFIKNNK